MAIDTNAGQGSEGIKGKSAQKLKTSLREMETEERKKEMNTTKEEQLE